MAPVGKKFKGGAAVGGALKSIKKPKGKPGKPRVFQKQNAKLAAKKKLDDLSESDIDSDEDFGMNGPEFGPLSDSTSSSDVDEQSQSPVDQSLGSDDTDEDGEAEEEQENDDEESSDEESSGEEIPEPEGSVEGDSPDEDDTSKSKRPKLDPERESRTIFVGNLPNDVKKMKLKKAFSKYGVVEAVRLRCAPIASLDVPRKVSAIQKNFHADRTNISAFVRFVDSDSVAKALKANGDAWDDTHHIRVDRASSATSEYDDKKAVFLGNLPFDVEEDEIRNVFLDCGNIVSIRIVRDRKTNVGKGFAYVNFSERHSVPLALQKNDEIVGKRKIRVKKCDYKKTRQELKDSKNRSSTFLLKREKHLNKKFPKTKKNVTEGETAKQSFQGESSKIREKKAKTRKNRKSKLKESKIAQIREVLNKPPKGGESGGADGPKGSKPPRKVNPSSNVTSPIGNGESSAKKTGKPKSKGGTPVAEVKSVQIKGSSISETPKKRKKSKPTE